MLKNLLFLSLFFLFSSQAHAQYIEYEPNPIPGSKEPQTRTSSTKPEVQIVSAYTLNQSTGTLKKYKIKIAVVQRSVRITGYKELSSEYWTNLHPVDMPVAQKLGLYDTFSENFEYKVYIPSLATSLYF